MREWRPEIISDEIGIERGPRTRQLGKSKRRAGKTLRFLRRFSGDRLATWATRAAARHGRPNLKVTYDQERDIYVVAEDELHAFAHPERLWTLFDGQIARGRKMAFEYLLDQIDFVDGDRIIDVGANTGDLALAFRAMGKKVHIEAFEPSPGEYVALQHNLENCSAVIGYRTHQLALWNESSEGLTFHLKPGHGDSSVLPIDGSTGEVRVPGKRLDEVLNSKEDQFRLLKLEAEGAEPEILQGAEGILDRIDYIAADVGFERGVDTQSTLPEVTNFLLERDFEIVGFEGNRFVILFKNRRSDSHTDG